METVRWLPAAFVDAPVEKVSLPDRRTWADDLERAALRLLTFRAELLGHDPNNTPPRLCAYCKTPVPPSLAPQARYCRPSCRQRAYEIRRDSGSAG